MKAFLRNNRWAILWSLLILLLTSLPGDLIPRIPAFADLFEPDKIVHVVMFAVLVYLWLQGLGISHPSLFLASNRVFLALSLAILLGGGTELLQEYLVPGRIASLYDFIANIAGSFAGWAIFIYVEKRKR